MRESDRYRVYELASPSARVIALCLDGMLLIFVAGLVSRLFAPSSWLLLAGVHALAGLVYHVGFLTYYAGQTPGKRALGIRVIRSDGDPLTASDAALRFLGYYLNTACLGVGWLWAWGDPNGQGWHDKLARTYVVRAD